MAPIRTPGRKGDLWNEGVPPLSFSGSAFHDMVEESKGNFLQCSASFLEEINRCGPHRSFSSGPSPCRISEHRTDNARRKLFLPQER